MGSDWLVSALKAEMGKSEASTPFERRFRRRLLDGLDQATGGGVLDDPQIKSALARIAKGDTVSLKDDALDVLDAARDETLAELIERLDALVIRAKTQGVVKSEGDGLDLWSGILASELRRRVRELQRKAGVDSGDYRQRFGTRTGKRTGRAGHYAETFGRRGG